MTVKIDIPKPVLVAFKDAPVARPFVFNGLVYVKTAEEWAMAIHTGRASPNPSDYNSRFEAHVQVALAEDVVVTVKF